MSGAADVGGSLSHVDLGNTKAFWRNALGTDIGSFTVLTSPPPTAGAITAVQIWAMISDGNRYLASDEIQRRHLFAEASMQAFLERSTTLLSNGASTRRVNVLLGKILLFLRVVRQVIQCFAVGPCSIPPALIPQCVPQLLSARYDTVGVFLFPLPVRVTEQWS